MVKSGQKCSLFYGYYIFLLPKRHSAYNIFIKKKREENIMLLNSEQKTLEIIKLTPYMSKTINLIDEFVEKSTNKKSAWITVNEINNPQHRGMFKFFDKSFIAKNIDADFISKMSQLPQYVNEVL
jgi:hypothetical protein